MGIKSGNILLDIVHGNFFIGIKHGNFLVDLYCNILVDVLHKLNVKEVAWIWYRDSTSLALLTWPPGIPWPIISTPFSLGMMVFMGRMIVRLWVMMPGLVQCD